MTKAFSEEEKEQIRTKIMETALDLFHDKGTKSLSIQELTKRVGIAQGSFYHFWKDKDALVLDVMKYRSKQKLEVVVQNLEESLHDPVGFLTEMIYVNAMDLMQKGEKQPVYSQSFALLTRADLDAENRVGVVYKEFLERLASYFVLFTNAVQFDRDYFEKIFKLFIANAVSEFIQK